MPFRILIAAGHGPGAQAARASLARELRDCELLPAYSRATLGELGGMEFDLVLLAWGMRTMAPDPLAGLRGLGPVAVMSAAEDLVAARAAVRAGAAGFVPYGLTAPVLAATVRLLLAGGSAVPAGVAAALLDAPRQVPRPAPRRRLGGTQRRSQRMPALGEPMTARELEVLGYVGQALSNKQIATLVGIEEVTVKLHVRKVMAKLGVANRTAAAIRGRELGLVG